MTASIKTAENRTVADVIHALRSEKRRGMPAEFDAEEWEAAARHLLAKLDTAAKLATQPKRRLP